MPERSSHRCSGIGRGRVFGSICNICHRPASCLYCLAHVKLIGMQKFITTQLFLLFLCCSAFAQEQEKAAQLAEIIRSVNVPGIQLIHTKNDKPEIYNIGMIGYGANQHVSSNTIFEAASLSKSVFAYAVLRLADRGLIQLDTPLLTYIGTYERFDRTNPAYGKITARMVLRHTTGLPNWGDSSGAKLLFPPDSCFSYSGEGYQFLQKTVEKITGKTLNQLAQAEVFGPLQMTHSSYQWITKFDTVSAFGNGPEEIKRHSVQNAAYSLLTNAHDYSIFLQSLASGKGLKKETWQMMLSTQTPANWFGNEATEANSHISWGLGVGLQQNEKGKAAWHWGDNGSFKCFYILFPATHESLVYFTHSNKGLFIAPEVVDLFLGKQTTWSIKWIGEGYDSPYVLKAFRARLLKTGFAHGAAVMADLQSKDPGFTLMEHDLNEFGYILLQQHDNNNAIDIFKLNTALHPESANAFDSMAEGYESAGNVALAIQNFKRCLELNPKNDYAAEHLKKLSGK